MDNAVVFLWQRTITNRIWSVITGVHEEQHQCDADGENKTKHFQFTMSFVYFDNDIR